MQRYALRGALIADANGYYITMAGHEAAVAKLTKIKTAAEQIIADIDRPGGSITKIRPESIIELRKQLKGD